MKRSGLWFIGVFFSVFFCALSISAQEEKKIRGGVLNGKAISLVKPEYPPAATAVGAAGTVNVEIVVDEEGNVVSANGVSGHPLLRSSSERAAKASKFSPTKLGGNPVKVSGILVYNFASAETANKRFVQKEEVEEEALNGQAKKLPSPEYPPAAKAIDASGKVKVQVNLDEKGNVVSAIAVSGHPLLRESSVKAAKKAKFDPTDIKNKNIKMDGIIIYVFFASPKEKEN